MLVFPRQADLAHNRISVLAPVASALLGRREAVHELFDKTLVFWSIDRATWWL